MTITSSVRLDSLLTSVVGPHHPALDVLASESQDASSLRARFSDRSGSPPLRAGCLWRLSREGSGCEDELRSNARTRDDVIPVDITCQERNTLTLVGRALHTNLGLTGKGPAGEAEPSWLRPRGGGEERPSTFGATTFG